MQFKAAFYSIGKENPFGKNTNNAIQKTLPFLFTQSSQSNNSPFSWEPREHADRLMH